VLRRYWFPIPGHLGIGVTADTRAEAIELATSAAARLTWRVDPATVVEDIDVRDLDQNHVIPNMGVVTWRGVWFPRGG
jgi:hypothetical protein